MAKYNLQSPVNRLLKLLQVDNQEIISIYIYALFNGIITLSLPLGIQAIINLISGGQISTSWVILVIFVIAGVALTGIMQIMQLSISENLQRKIFTRSAFEFAYRIPKVKLESVDKIYVPELVNRFFDTLSVQKGLSKILLDFSSASLQIIFGLLLLSLYHPFFIFFSLLLVVLLYLIIRLTAPKALETALTESTRKYEVAHWLEELARAMETFKLAGKSQLPLGKTDEVVSDYLTARKSHFKTLLLQYINFVGLKVLIAAGLLLIGGLLVINQQMNIGQFVAAEIIIILVLTSVEKLILTTETVYDVLASLEKIGLVTDIPLERDNGEADNVVQGKGLSVRLSNLSYRFDDKEEDKLKDINLNIAAGEKVCLAGYNGSGKSLLLQIMAALYEKFSGTIAYNNLPVGNWRIEDLRSLIGDNLTKEDIFSGTLKENLYLGKPNIDMQEIKDAVEVVGLSEFIASLPKGYDTVLFPEGNNLPKSIRLKITLARCLIGAPKLLLLEDNFNQLNEIDKDKFLTHLLSQEMTILAVSTDIDVVKRFERVVVLENGELNELGEDKWSHKVFQSN